MFHFMVDIHIYFGGVGCSNRGYSGVEWLQDTSCGLIDPPTRFAARLIHLIKSNFTSSLRVWALVAAYA